VKTGKHKRCWTLERIGIVSTAILTAYSQGALVNFRPLAIDTLRLLVQVQRVVGLITVFCGVHTYNANVDFWFR
jgi:hypothetical protein